jgi:hypothetical protein
MVPLLERVGRRESSRLAPREHLLANFRGEENQAFTIAGGLAREARRRSADIAK